MGYEEKVVQGLERAYRRAETQVLDLPSARYIIFSDHHKGKRDGADDFRGAEVAYHAALGYYLAAGHTLCVLGDVEELWECRARHVVQSYRRTLQLEAEFHSAGRYVRFFGNHDDQWESRRSVRKHLERFFPRLQVREGLRLQVEGGEGELADVFLVHGHQGTAESDKFRWISKPVVRYIWRPFQRLTGTRLNTPAKSFKLRAKHSKAMHAWAATKGGVVLIAGHTHKPVFLPEPRTRVLAERLAALERSGAAREEIGDVRAELEWLRAIEATDSNDNGPVGDDVKPCYFNTGCCSFDDGDCTGIEIADGQIRLVRWPDDAGRPRKQVLREADLRAVLARCQR
jgi:UDP-2,3-diacylglucosamine pyrophosphatase LpxH